MNIIEVKHLTKHLVHLGNSIRILEEINLTLKKGETLAIMGASGSGKTTLLSLLAGLDVPNSGEIWIEARPLHAMTEDERALFRRDRIGFIFQQFELLPQLSVLENVMLPLEIAGHKNVDKKAKEIIDKVGLKHRLKHLPRELSGGEQQRVSIARAFVIQPKILFLDEPTGSLDSINGNHILELVFELNNQFHTTLIFVTHDERVAKLCQRQMSLKNGRLFETSK